MAKLSACYDGSTQVPAEAIVPGISDDPEMVLRSLFDQIVLVDCSLTKNQSSGCTSGELGLKFLPGQAPHEVYIEFSDKLTRWIQNLCGGDQADGQSRDQIERLICKILNEKIPKSQGSSDLCNLRGWGPLDTFTVLQDSLTIKYDERLLDMLRQLREVALDPGGLTVSWDVYESWKLRRMILNTREVLMKRSDGNLDADDLPYRKKQRVHRYLDKAPKVASWAGTSYMEQSQGNGLLNLPKRRSQRTISLLKIGESSLRRKRIPVGPSFQADVPEWTGKPPEKVAVDQIKLSDARWLGTRMWPIEGHNAKSDAKSIGRGRDDSCSCSSTRSMECIRYHVGMARLHLTSELGQAFFSMGFDNMGEEVSNSWSPEEQMTFDSLVRMNSVYHENTFLYPPLRSFPPKSRQNLVSYYFNVHVLRRMSFKTRSTFGKVDSDDDERSGRD